MGEPYRKPTSIELGQLSQYNKTLYWSKDAWTPKSNYRGYCYQYDDLFRWVDDQSDSRWVKTEWTLLPPLVQGNLFNG